MKYTDETSKISYSLGLSVASNLIQSGIKTIEASAFVDALETAFGGKTPEITPEEANKILQDFFGKMQAEQADANVKAGKEFLEKNKEQEGIITLDSGLQYQVITEGTGDKPKETDSVKCHYHGTLIDGTVFDSSVQRNQPAVFPVNGVIKGWVEALQLMAVGSKWRLFIPSELAYGAQGAGQHIQPHTTLIFEVELLGIEK